MANDKIYFSYDPQKQGYDTVLWKTISGVPAISGSDLRLNSAAIIHYGDIFKGELTMNLNIPTAPTAGDDRLFGFNQLNAGAYAYFKVADDVFTAEVNDGEGGTDSVVIDWQTDWTAADTNFKIVWMGFSAVFYVNKVKFATINSAGVPKFPLSIYIKNGNADNMDMKYIEVENVHNYI